MTGDVTASTAGRRDGTRRQRAVTGDEDPLVAWERLNRLVSQLQLTHEQFGHVLDRLAAEVEARRPDTRR